MKRLLKPFLYLSALLLCFPVHATTRTVKSPDGKLTLAIADDTELRFSLSVDGKPVVVPSRLGLEFKDGTSFGASTSITASQTARHRGTWENRFGKRRIVPDRWNEIRLTLQKNGDASRRFGLIARAYDDGVAFRYDLPVASGLGNFVLTRELTEFRFAADYASWLGEPSDCAESQYSQARLSQIAQVATAGKPYKGVLPMLVETPGCYVAVSESDLMDWAGLFLSGTGGPAVTATLAPRGDGNGLVASATPRVSPWRVMMVGRKAADLLNTDLIATLATPNQLGDVSWVKPGVSAWDAWWTGINPHMPQFTGLNARGNTESHKEYIDFAVEMGWKYQLVDWFWYDKDITKPLPHVNIPELVEHAKQKNVKLFLWMHSADLTRIGFDKVFSTVSSWGFAGVKVDFMNDESQSMVQWYADALATAARYQLMVDFHGAYKPTGLARTYPNYITQEGVLGNEFNKLPGNKCTPLHTVTLPFTRGLLGPMDFTPGGFLNRTPQDFKVTYPAQVMGTRSRQLAMTVIYLSPLLVMCDSPTNYRNQPGIEYLRELPTVWDETVILNAEVGKAVVLARRSGNRWYLAGMNGDEAANFELPLRFLGKGKWTLRSFADDVNAAPTAIVEKSLPVNAKTTVPVTMAPAGGFVATLTLSP